jgi:hypothetical protein
MKAQNIIEKTGMEVRSRALFQNAARIALSMPGKLLVAAIMLFILASVPMLTRAHDGDEHTRNERHALTGNWIVTVTPVPAAPTFLSLLTYFDDGNLLQETSNPVIRSTGRGTWTRTGHRQFTQSITFFRFDAARTYLGTRVINSTITLSEDGQQYHAESVGQNFDLAGNLVSTSGATEVAQRL